MWSDNIRVLKTPDNIFPAVIWWHLQVNLEKKLTKYFAKTKTFQEFKEFQDR